MPTHHQVELFDEITSSGINLKVIYTRTLSAGRNWIIKPETFAHNHTILREIRIKDHWYFNFELQKVLLDIWRSDIVIVGQYASITMQIAMYFSAILRKELVFWSEPIEGVKYEERKLINNKKLSFLLRRIALFPIKYFAQNLWGIGKMGVRTFENLKPLGRISKFNYYSNLEKFYQSYEKRSDLETDVKFIFCGSYSKRKGIDLIIDSCKILKKRGSNNFRIEFIGRGEYADKLKEIESDTIVDHGFVQQEKVSNFYIKNDVLLYPSRYDGWGMSLVEAMACGVPVIASKEVGSAIELIDESNGFFIKNLTGDSLANIMQRIINNKRVLKSMNELCIETSKKLDVKYGSKLFKKLISQI